MMSPSAAGQPDAGTRFRLGFLEPVVLKTSPPEEVVLDDLAPGRAPHTFVAQDIGERRVERADPVRHVARSAVTRS
jgi:hypothetical protein